MYRSTRPAIGLSMHQDQCMLTAIEKLKKSGDLRGGDRHDTDRGAPLRQMFGAPPGVLLRQIIEQTRARLLRLGAQCSLVVYFDRRKIYQRLGNIGILSSAELFFAGVQ